MEALSVPGSNFTCKTPEHMKWALRKQPKNLPHTPQLLFS